MDRPLRSSIDPPGIPSPRNIHTLDDKRETPGILPRVSFDDSISVRLYNTVLGDNPSVRNGPPVSLGWVYTPEKRPMGEQRRRGHKHCYLDTPTRIYRLRKNGVTVPEMEDAIAEVQNLQDLRRSNLNLIVRTKAPVVTESRKRPLSPRNNNAGPLANASSRVKKEDFLPVSNPHERQPWATANHHHNHHHHHQLSQPNYYYYAIGMKTPSPSRALQQPYRLPAYHIPRRPPLQPIQPMPSTW